MSASEYLTEEGSFASHIASDPKSRAIALNSDRSNAIRSSFAAYLEINRPLAASRSSVVTPIPGARRPWIKTLRIRGLHPPPQVRYMVYRAAPPALVLFDVWEDAENITNRTVKAPPKTGENAAPGGISRPQLALRGTSLEH